MKTILLLLECVISFLWTKVIFNQRFKFLKAACDIMEVGNRITIRLMVEIQYLRMKQNQCFSNIQKIRDQVNQQTQFFQIGLQRLQVLPMITTEILGLRLRLRCPSSIEEIEYQEYYTMRLELIYSGKLMIKNSHGQNEEKSSDSRITPPLKKALLVSMHYSTQPPIAIGGHTSGKQLYTTILLICHRKCHFLIYLRICPGSQMTQKGGGSNESVPKEV